MKTLLLLLITASTATAQISPFGGLSIGHLNNISTEIKAGAFIGKVMIEGSAAFSQVMPMQLSAKVGYQFGERWYLMPQVGYAWQSYGTDKYLNTSGVAFGGEFGRVLNNEFCQVYANAFGIFKGIGFRVKL